MTIEMQALKGLVIEDVAGKYPMRIIRGSYLRPSPTT
jgi:hypothetical protein